MTKEMKGFFLLLFIEDTIGFLKCFVSLTHCIMLSPLYSYQGDQPAELISPGLLLLVACPPNQQETSQLLSGSHSGVEFNPNRNAVFLIQLVAGSALNSRTCEASRSQLIISDCELNRGVTLSQEY